MFTRHVPVNLFLTYFIMKKPTFYFVVLCPSFLFILIVLQQFTLHNNLNQEHYFCTKEQWNVHFILVIYFSTQENEVRSVKGCTEQRQHNSRRHMVLYVNVWQTHNHLKQKDALTRDITPKKIRCYLALKFRSDQYDI